MLIVNAVTEMADNNNYYYLKLKDHFFDTEKIVFLESLPDGFLYSNILLKLSLLSLKGNGRLMFNERIPYNADILSKLTKHPVGVVEKAIDILKEFDLIKVMDNGAIYITDIQNYVGKSSTEADRQRDYQRRLKESGGIDENAICEESNDEPNGKPNGYESNMESCKESNDEPNKTCEESNRKSTPEKELNKSKSNNQINNQSERLDLDSEMQQIQQIEQKRLAKIAEHNKNKKPESGLIPLVPESAPPPPPPPSEKSDISLSDEDIKYFIHYWNNLGVEPIKELSEKQIQKLEQNVKQFGDGQVAIDAIGYLFDSITDSSYLLGETEPKFNLMLNWVLVSENWGKIIIGDYCNWEESTC